MNHTAYLLDATPVDVPEADWVKDHNPAGWATTWDREVDPTYLAALIHDARLYRMGINPDVDGAPQDFTDVIEVRIIGWSEHRVVDRSRQHSALDGHPSYPKHFTLRVTDAAGNNHDVPLLKGLRRLVILETS